MSVFQPCEVVSTAEAELGDIMCKCHDDTQPEEGDTCASLGEKKHECCEAAIKNGSSKNIGGEQGYNAKAKSPSPLGQTRSQMKASGTLGGTLWPDAAALDSSGNPAQFYDFKFKCPPGTPTGYYDKHSGAVLRAGRNSSPGGDFYVRGGRNSQFNKYKKLGKKLSPPTTADPRPIESSACK